eukprot:6203249-Pleurochrysis_carterae.AAC.1
MSTSGCELRDTAGHGQSKTWPSMLDATHPTRFNRISGLQTSAYFAADVLDRIIAIASARSALFSAVLSLLIRDVLRRVIPVTTTCCVLQRYKRWSGTDLLFWGKDWSASSGFGSCERGYNQLFAPSTQSAAASSRVTLSIA